MPTFQREIKWQAKWSGPVVTVTSGEHETMAAATREAVGLAIGAGWTEPKWYEFWRWNEPSVDATVLGDPQNPIPKP